MATDLQVYDVSRIAGADLSAALYFMMQLSAAKTVTLAGAADADLYGILQNKPAASGRAATVRRIGSSKLEIGDTVTFGDKLTSDVSGKGVPATSGQRYCAVALESGVDGDIISVEMEIGYVP